jgi:hypothetical protein
MKARDARDRRSQGNLVTNSSVRTGISFSSQHRASGKLVLLAVSFGAMLVSASIAGILALLDAT